MNATTKVVSSEISGNLLKNFFHFIRFNYNHITINNKHVLTNNSPIFVF